MLGRDLAQPCALHLRAIGARRRRKGFKAKERCRHLEPGEPPPAELAQRGFVERSARPQRYEADRHQTALTRDADDLAAVDRGMLLDICLDFARRDEIAAEPEHVAHPPLEYETAIGKHPREIAGAEEFDLR